MRPNDVWAVGAYSSGAHFHQTLVLHWDGVQWTLSPSPNLASDDTDLNAVVALARNDVWAVGKGGPMRTLSMHWDGTQWSLVPAPGYAGLNAVVALGPQDLWAVGGEEEAPLTLHGNGQTWTLVPNPEVELPPGARGRTISTFNDLAAVAPADVWAVGATAVSNVPAPPLLEHWDGTQWSQIPSPLGADTGAFLGAAADVDGGVWIVGGHRPAGVDGWAQPVILRHTRTPCAPVGLPGSVSQHFPETDRVVSGLFLDYWQQHGGIDQQGYPISDVIGAVSELDGQLYTAQYFERALFEYHPENKPPYNVLLAQLGTFRYGQKYPAGASNQTPNPANGHYFAQTGHWVGGPFWAYWQRHGGLAQQGYPISDEFTEVSDLDGQPYTVQYFQRAVFEYHPENAGTPYAVLLSQLGTFQARQLGPAPPVPSP
ncbi:MAG TPA: hypothetical protein VKY74_12060 [Chloroflexia bacterium]|nr:hypothetical protein [Chloroflexia bacterium]